MSSVVRRSLFFTLGLTAAAYLFFIVITALEYPADQLLPQFRAAWLFEEALRLLIEALPTVIISAVIMAFATMRAGAGISSGADSLPRLIGRLMVLFILFTLLYTALDIGLKPRLYRDRFNRLYLSRLAGEFMEKAEQAETREEREEAARYYRNYLSIVEEDAEIGGRLEVIEGSLSLTQGEEKKEKKEKPFIARRELQNLTAVELMERGSAALEDEDPFTAHFLAQMAVKLEPDREDARRLAAKAWDRIGTMAPSRDEEQLYKIYREKLRGYEALQEGRPVEAYYLFHRLNEKAPEDPDVKEYLEESRLQARNVSFFIEDARETDTLPGTPSIIYAEPKGITGDTQIVYIGKLVRDGRAVWLHDVEVLHFSPSPEGGISRSSHIRAQYAKLSSRISEGGDPYSLFIFRGIDRYNDEIEIKPQFSLSGTEEGEDFEALSGPLKNVYRSSAPLSDLLRLSRDHDFFERLSLLDLFILEKKYEVYHHPRSKIQLITLMRLLGPFLILVLSLLGVGIGLRFRPRKDGVPVFLYPSLLFVPFLLDYLISFYVFGHRLIFAGLLNFGGFALGLSLFLVLQGLILFLAIFYCVRYRES
jgi:hypothetical protein